MRRIKRPASSLAILALLAGCNESASSTAASAASASAASADSRATAPGPSPAPSSSPALAPRVAVDPKLVDALRDGAVTDASFARRVLYSWTTSAQEKTMRREQKLLLDTELPSGPTPYVELLGKTADRSGPDADLARLLLLHPSLRLRRYAWTRPWATRFGVADHDYGGVLVRVVLAPNAIIARFNPEDANVFTFHDLDDRPVSLAEALANPSRIAAVFHVRTDAHTPIAHREYVICNEAMVSEWSLAAPESRVAIQEDVALLTALAHAALPSQAAKSFWTREPDRNDASALFAASVAFDTDRYRSSEAALGAIAEALDHTENAGPPLIVTPTARFDLDAVVPKIAVRRPPVRVARVI